MAAWPWHKILLRVALLSILIGVGPLGYWFWWKNTHNLVSLAMPIPLQRGEYTSPYFTTNVDDVYQIDIYFLPWDRSPLKIAWSVVGANGRVIQRGTYQDLQHGGNGATLGHYRPKLGERQKIIVAVQNDVAGEDTYPNLYVELPELGLDLAEGYLPAALLWAASFVGIGVIMLALSFSGLLKRRGTG